MSILFFGYEDIMGKVENNLVKHNFEPIYDKNSKILILGTMPSVKSRQAKFYYMNPQNLFWRIISDVLCLPFPKDIEEKTAMLINNNIAVWDVLKSCEIEGSLDSSIRNPVPNDLSEIFNTASIEAVFTNGTKATSLYKSHCEKVTSIKSIYLPSTSPANKKFYNYNTIYEAWKEIREYLQK